MKEKYYGKGSNKKANPGPSGGEYSSEHSGMPTEKVMKEYSKRNYDLEGYDDTIQGIDMFAEMNHSKVKKQQRTLKDS